MSNTVQKRRWRSDDRPQNVRVGKYFMLSDFLYSESATKLGIPNCPALDGKEVQGIRGLCTAILDPVVERFGSVSITYGYASPALHRQLYGNRSMGVHNGVAPAGASIAGAADILIHSMSEGDRPRAVLNWIRDNCVYDRLILYPGSVIVCTAWTDKPRYHAKEWLFPDNFSKAIYVNLAPTLPLFSGTLE